MLNNPTGRGSSINRVSSSAFDREEKSTRTDLRRTLSRAKSNSLDDNSLIPRPKYRALSVDAASRKSMLKAIQSQTPITPSAGPSRIHHGHTASKTTRGRRSHSVERANGISGKGPRKDTRPLPDKSSQAQMLSKIESYFRNRGQGVTLNGNGSLRPITLKLFVEVSNELLMSLNIKHDLTMSNYVEELPKIAKKLHYPGVIAKSWLKTVNTIHSWPRVLDWLFWLVQFCTAKDLATDAFKLKDLPQSGTDDESQINRLLFHCMLRCYSAWNDEKHNEESALIEEFLRTLNDRFGVSEEVLVTARSNVEATMFKLQALDEKKQDLEKEIVELDEVLESLQKDDVKQQAYIRAKKEYIEKIDKEENQMKNECELLAAEIEKQRVMQEELEKRIAHQPMSTNERDKVVEECLNIKRHISRFEEHLTEIKKELYTLDLKLASINNNISKTVLAYNKEIFLNLDCIEHVHLEELKMPEEGILRPDVLDSLNSKANAMNELKELLNNGIDEKRVSIKKANDELEGLKERKRMLEEENNELITSIKERKTEVDNIKMNARNEEIKLKDQIRTLDDDIKKLQESMPDIVAENQELTEMKDKLESLQRRKLFLQSKADEFFPRFYDILQNHREKVAALLGKMLKE
ncbi:kinetochore protein NDC80 homolog [Orussus abietinus]|uniref:kinetochore protein NDC80 homolog n=1 Tax=Orussus abietinus TaxID=222816 RepID=UPI000625EEEA|nr:kinetochore protein NDC80 homolog [Orussus abietinus]